MYKVRSNVPVCNAMTKSEGNKIVSKSNPKCEDIWIGDEHLEDLYTTWEFLIEGIPNVKRWLSNNNITMLKG